MFLRPDRRSRYMIFHSSNSLIATTSQEADQVPKLRLLTECTPALWGQFGGGGLRTLFTSLIQLPYRMIGQTFRIPGEGLFDLHLLVSLGGF